MSEYKLLAPQMMVLQKESMKAKTKLRTATLRLIASNFKQVVIDQRKGVAEADRKDQLTEAQEIAVIKSMMKQRVDSAQQFEDAGRVDLQEKELAEIVILKGLLPQQMSTEEMTAIVQVIVDSLDSPTMKQMGMIMGRLQVHKETANMGEMNTIVRQLLS